MKARNFIIVVLLAGLVLPLAWASAAEKPELPAAPGRASEVPPASSLYWDGGSSSHLRSPASKGTVAAEVGPAVTPGQPGTVFRYARTFGETEVAYFRDANHLNYPYGVGVDGSGNLWVAEISGGRVMKYTAGGSFLMSIGTAGLIGRVDDTHFNSPADVAVDGGGNIWVVDGSPSRVVKYDSGGNYLMQLGETWERGSDNDHFRQPRGVALDSAGNIYVSDGDNHRIQVFDSSGAYSATLGVTGEPGSDNAHFDVPRHIAVDSDDNLYVADAGNHRVQIFNGNHNHVGTIGVSGEPGSDNNHLDWPMGVAVDANHIYVADLGNHRIQIFDRATRVYRDTIGSGSAGSSNNEFAYPSDVAVDSLGNIYVADHDNCRVQKFNSSLVYQSTFGTTGVPYLTDGYHYNEPVAVAVDASGHIGLVEGEGPGCRFVKLNASGVPQFSLGQAGVCGTDNAHFYNPYGVAFDANGAIYVADGSNHRVQIFSADGTYQATLGTGFGTGNYQFYHPHGVAIDGSGNIYVADSDNHRVQIYNSNRLYIATLGVTGEYGSDNGHFTWPLDVYVDGSGNIYVADGWNHRVQKFNSSRVYELTLGTTGERRDDFDHFDEPSGVAVDAVGNIYVADRYNNRVQVFDTGGAYLTTIGGDWGSSAGQFRGPTGVAVDDAGSVYIADHHNQRIQKFTPGVPGWRQVNVNGFGNRTSYLVGALVPFDDQLYAGIYNPDTGAQLWRKRPTTGWTAVFTDGMDDTTNVGIDHLMEFKGKLYASTWNETSGGGSNGGQILRSATGDRGDWEQVASGGFTSTNNSEVFRLLVFKNQLFASTWNPTDGAELWRSSSGDSGSWAPMTTGGFDDPDNKGLVSLVEFDGHLYAGTDNTDTGTEVWRSPTGTAGTWTQVNVDGFADHYNWSVTLEPFEGYLYAGTYNYGDSDNPGLELWRCQQCDGTDWVQIPIAKGFSDTENRSIRSLVTFSDALFAFTYNRTTGMEVWQTSDGTVWRQVGTNGLGDSNNYSPYWDNSTTIFNGNLMIGTWNPANGGEMWQMLRRVYLPLVLRSH